MRKCLQSSVHGRIAFVEYLIAESALKPSFQTPALSRVIWNPAIVSPIEKAGFQLALRKSYAWLE